MRNIFVISEMIGDFEIIEIAPIKDLNSIKTLVNQIKRLPSVDKVEIALINDTEFPVNSRFGNLFL